jgi:hypothetical protein
VLAAACIGAHAVAADFTSFEATPLKEPECITDASQSFVAQNGAPFGERWHPLPVDRYYMVVRYLGDDAVAAAPAFDFSRFPPSYGWPAARGQALTHLTVPEPKSAWQRAKSADAGIDTSSAFQLHCYDAASYLNTWTFPYGTVIGGGPHAIYGYSFSGRPPPAIYDRNPATDFVLQASIEVPWFAAWADPAAASQPIGQASFFAYFRDRFTDKTFALLLAVFDNRYATSPTYASFVAHDGQTPFVSMPLNAHAAYATPSPYSAAFTGTPWTGLKFFRAHITQQNFRDAVAAINAYCRAHLLEQQCNLMPYIWDAFSPSVDNYELTEFGVLHELFRGPGHNLSMAVHVHDLGAWNFR